MRHGRARDALGKAVAVRQDLAQNGASGACLALAQQQLNAAQMSDLPLDCRPPKRHVGKHCGARTQCHPSRAPHQC